LGAEFELEGIYSSRVLRGVSDRAMWRAGLLVAILACILAAALSSASAASAECAIPIVDEPAWGFRAGDPYIGGEGPYARGHGEIDLSTRTVSGVVCEGLRPRHEPERWVLLSVGNHLLYSSHSAVMWGVPGNIMKIDVRVKVGTDPDCPVGTWGRMTIFASYNGVKRDSAQFFFPAHCKSLRRLFRGPVVANVPPE
jgi:hypothetical protein